MTATQQIIQALAENAKIFIDHETKAFMGFRFRLAGAERDTVVRVHKQTAEFASLMTAVK